MTPRARSLCQRSTRQLQQSRKHSRVYYRPRFGSDGKGKRPVALTKAELAEALFEDLGLNKREAKEFVDLFFEEIRGRLEAGKEVKLSGFGHFELRSRNQRPGRNPKRSEEHTSELQSLIRISYAVFCLKQTQLTNIQH